MSNKTTILRAAIGIFLLSATFAWADATPAASESEKVVFVLRKMHVDDALSSFIRRGAPAILDGIRLRNPNLTPPQLIEVGLIVQSVLDEQLAQFLSSVANNIYANQFTPQEIDALYQFYQTPLGASISIKMIRASRLAAREGAVWAGTLFLPEVERRIHADQNLSGVKLH